MGLDDYERDRKTDHQAWRQKNSFNIRLSSSSSLCQYKSIIRIKTTIQFKVDIIWWQNNQYCYHYFTNATIVLLLILHTIWDQAHQLRDKTRSQPCSTLRKISEANSSNVSAQPKVIWILLTIIIASIIDEGINMITMINDEHVKWWSLVRYADRTRAIIDNYKQGKQGGAKRITWCKNNSLDAIIITWCHYGNPMPQWQFDVKLITWCQNNYLIQNSYFI